MNRVDKLTAKSARLSRRRLLSAGASAGLLSWPFLGLPRLEAVHAQTVHPLRLLLMFDPNGTIQSSFWPTPGASETDFTLSPIAAPLEPFKDRLLFLKGLNISVAEVGPGGPHQKGVGGLFTNNTLQEGTFVDGDGAQAGWADGISVDQEVAKHVGEQCLFPSLELGVRGVDPEVRGRISYAGPGNPMPPINSPLKAYERLFSAFQGADASLLSERRSVVDAVKQQYAAIAPRLGTVDQLKLEQHLELMRGIERRLNLSVNGGVCTGPEAPPALEEDDELTMPDIAALQGQLLTSAFACDLTRVASLQYSTARNEIRFPWLDSLGSGHALSHAGDSDVEAVSERVARARWFAEQLANLMTQLDAIPEGEGSVLDNTLIIWANELGAGNTHSHDNIPFLLAGGAGGKFRMGRFLDYGGRSHAGLLVAVLNALGIDKESFGHPDYADGALPNLT